MPTHHEGSREETRALDAYITLMRAAESVTARTSAIMAAHDLTVSQFGALEALLHLGPLHQRALGEKLLKTSGNITMVVDNLEKRGLVERRREGDDRRFIRVCLTDAGRRTIRKAFPEVLAEIVASFSHLSAPEQEQVRRLCRKLGRGAAAKENPQPFRASTLHTVGEATTAVDPQVLEARYGALTDDDVIARVRSGDLPMFEVLMRRHNQRVFRVARSVLGDADEAEDVLQEAWVRAFESLDRFEGRASFATWVTKIALHEALARARARERLAPLDPSLLVDEVAVRPLPKNDPGPRESAEARELERVLEKAIDALPEIHRSAFVLREVEGMSTAEAADALGITEDALKVRLHRARAALREDMERRTGEARAGVYAFRLDRCDRVVAAVLARITAPR